MKIAVIGAAGKAGTHILREAIMRKFDVTAIVKNKATVQENNINIIESDLFKLTKEQIAPFDILINAFAPLPGEEHLHVDAGEHLISLLEGTEKNYLLSVVQAAFLLTVKKQFVLWISRIIQKTLLSQQRLNCRTCVI